jgi:pyridoxamine 5'-phosphate oxidase
VVNFFGSVDQASQTLQIFTDQRSPKVVEIVNEPKAIFVFWSARLNWQLRVRVCVSNQAYSAHVEASNGNRLAGIGASGT